MDTDLADEGRALREHFVSWAAEHDITHHDEHGFRTKTDLPVFVFLLVISTEHEVSFHALDDSIPAELHTQLAMNTQFHSALTAIRLLPRGDTTTRTVSLHGQPHLVTVHNTRPPTDESLNEVITVLIQPGTQP